MKPLILDASEFTPKVVLDADKHFFEIAGVSRPENVQGFYDPIISWFKDYHKKELTGVDPQSAGPLKFVFKMEYFNSATSKALLQLLEYLAVIKKDGYDLQFDWYYDEWDDQMLEDGEDLADAVNLKFNCIPREVDLDDEDI
ncbi:MAG: DUF1987 domain-containing protein [Bacteroidota bacterium]